MRETRDTVTRLGDQTPVGSLVMLPRSRAPAAKGERISAELESAADLSGYRR